MKRSGLPLTQQARRRALVLLASCPDGCTEAILAAHNIQAEIVAKLLRKGLATAAADHVGRVWITERGRREPIGW
jgi:putative heme iron utilization protein